jgi:membrane-bound lytic murein transglycosylase D
LVIAAYNTGPGNVNSAIRRSGSRNFWDLQAYLPAETRSHVKKFIATHYIMEGDGGLTTLTKKETDGLVLTSSIQSTDASIGSVTLTGRFTSGAIADGIQMNLSAFSKLNPNFDKALSVNGTYELRLPNEKLALFQANRSLILEQSIRNMLTATR